MQEEKGREEREVNVLRKRLRIGVLGLCSLLFEGEKMEGEREEERGLNLSKREEEKGRRERETRRKKVLSSLLCAGSRV